MPYVCRVRITNQKDLDGITDVSVRARMSRGECFHVSEDPGPLKHVWERYHQRGNLSVERSPLRDPFDDSDVFWVERKRTDFVRARPGAIERESIASESCMAAHAWIQVELERLGRLLGDCDVSMEYPVPGARIDVRWGNSAIAWEVDLTLPPTAEQSRRERRRAEAGMRFISVVDAEAQRPPLAEFPTMSVLHLKFAADNLAQNRYAFSRLSVCSAFGLDVRTRTWTQSSLNVGDFCSALLRKQLEYVAFDETHRVQASHGWVRVNDWERWPELLRARAHAEAVARKRARRAMLLRHAEQAASQAAINKLRVQSLAEECERVTELLDAFDVAACPGGRLIPLASSTATAVGENASLLLRQFREAVEAAHDAPWWKRLFVIDSLYAEAQRRRRDAIEALHARAKELESQLVECASFSRDALATAELLRAGGPIEPVTGELCSRESARGHTSLGSQ